jgi:hypothetical protein
MSRIKQFFIAAGGHGLTKVCIFRHTFIALVIFCMITLTYIYWKLAV